MRVITLRPLQVRKRKSQIFCLTLLLIFGSFYLYVSTVAKRTWANDKKNDELLLVYDFVPGYQDPPHLTPVNDKNLVPRNAKALYPIDTVHRKGLIHAGTWINIRDSEGKYLVIKRGPQLITCPNSFTLVGEHSQGAEKPIHTVRRGIKEEIGPAMLDHIKSITPLSTNPLFFRGDYFNRVDRQLTYIYLVDMDDRGEKLPLLFDNEVAEYRWISNRTLEEWFSTASNEFNSRGVVGERMCHKAILDLWKKVHSETQKLIMRRAAHNGQQKQ